MSVAFNPVDVHVGSRIKLRRQMLELSQEVLAESLGVTFQQVQKYERGANRISASRLYDVAHRLNVSVQFFYEGLPPLGEAANDAGKTDPFHEKDVLELVTCYQKLAPPVQAALLALIKAQSKSRYLQHKPQPEPLSE